MPSERLISRLQLVGRVSVSKSQLYRDCERGGKLHDALVGPKVNLDHKNARVYCAEHNYREPDVLAIKAEVRREEGGKPRYDAAPQDYIPPDAIEDDNPDAIEYMGMTLRDIVRKFGKQSQFKELVGAYKILVSTQQLEEKIARDRRDFCAFVHIERLAMHIDGLHKQLLGDVAKSIALEVVTLSEAGASEIDIRKAVTELLEKVIQMTKVRSAEIIRNAKS